MRRLKKGDDVVIIAGKDKGKRGSIVTVISEDKVVVASVNMVKRHTKGNPQRGTAGGIIEKEMPIHASNVALFNPTTKKADRIGFRVLEDGRKVRFYKSNSEVVDI